MIKMLDEETWLTAEDCIRLGLADRYAEQNADMAAASSVLQKAKLNLEQRINLQKTLAAQLRDMVKDQKPPVPADPPADPPADSHQNGPTDLMQQLSGMFKN